MQMEAFKKENINIKNYLLLIMAVVIVGFIIFRPTSGEIDENEEKVERLKLENKKLEDINDSLKMDNELLEREMDKIYTIIELRDTELVEIKNNIKVLEGKRNEIRNTITTMGGDDVSRTYTNYLKRRGKNNN